MPAVGFGTFPILDPAVFEQAIVEAGYRHLDTASFYHNEEEVGEGI
jgi:diketogulonate reductase-like aldo/keto reductase